MNRYMISFITEMDVLLLADEEDAEDDVIRDLRRKRDSYLNKLKEIELQLNLI